MKDMLLTYRYPFMALAVAAAAIALSATPGLSLDPGSSIYVRTDMVSDNTASVPAAVQDKRLLNSWGIVILSDVTVLDKPQQCRAFDAVFIRFKDRTGQSSVGGSGPRRPPSSSHD